MPEHGYARIPPGARRGMVVIHEIFGSQPEIDRVVERFAAQGWAAVAPDLFAGGIGCVVQAFKGAATGRGPAVEKVRAARDWLCAESGISPSSVGLIGFCFGGGFALAAGPGFAAVSSNYGAVPSTEVMRGIGPVIGCYAGRDVIFGKTGETLRKRLQPLGITPEVNVFPEVGHSFLTDGHHPVGAALSRFVFHLEARDPAVVEEAWRKIFAFLEEKVPQ